MIDSTVPMDIGPLIRRHNSCVDFTFLQDKSDMNSQKLTRLNTLFERAADRKSGGIRQDKLARILPKGQITSLKYDVMLKYGKKEKKDLRIISRGPFLAMFSQESVSFFNSLAVNERLERERRQRRHVQSLNIQPYSSFDDSQRERAQSAPSGMLRDISNLSEKELKRKKKKRRDKEQKSGFEYAKEKKNSNSKRKSKGSKEKKSIDGKEKRKKSKEKGHRRKQSISSGSSSTSSGKIKGKVKETSSDEFFETIKAYKAETSENEASGSTFAISDSSIEPPTTIKVSFCPSSEETKSSDFTDSFGEIMISNDPSFTHLSYSYSISDDEVENTTSQELHEENLREEVDDEKLCSFLNALSFFLRNLVPKKAKFVSKDSSDFKELEQQARHSFPYADGSDVPPTILTRPKSKLRNSVGGKVVPMNNDCPFRQSPSMSRKSVHENSYYKFVR